MGDRLAAGDLELTEVLRRVLEGSGATRLLLVVDDFHLLARGVDGHDRNAFLAGLEGAMGALPLSLCVAFRSECYTELMDLISGFGRATELAGALEHGLLHLGPLRAEQIAEAIEGPARLTGLGLEDGLLDTIVADTLTAPGGPAALSLALEQTWRQHRENLLSAEGYARIGGAVGVLGRQAEQGFHLLDPERRRRMRDAVTARLAWVPECPLLADEGGHSLAAWPRARAWLEEEQGFVLWRRELHRALARWQNQGQNPVAALQPSAQLEAQAWLKRRQEDLTSEEQEFIRLGTKSPGGGESTAKRRPWRRPHSVRRAAGWFMAGMGVAGVALILALWRVAPPGTGRVAGSGVSAQGVASHDRGAAAEAEQSLRGRAHLRVKEMSFRQGTAVEDIAFNPESVLAVAGRDGIARLWNPVEKTLLLTLEGHRLAITRLAFSADGKRLATAGRDRSVRVWDSAGGRLLHTLTGHLDAINDVAFSHDGRYIAAAGDDHSVRLWNATTGQLLHSFTEHVAEVDRIAFSPDDRLLLSTTGDGSAWLWSLADRRLIARLGGHTGIIEKAAFSPDGRLIAGVGAMPEVRLWKAADGSPLQRLAGHSGTIHDIAFAPDSKRLATAGDDATVRLWSLSDDTPPLVLDRHEDAVRKVVFGPRGRLLASIGDDRLAFLRDARSGLRILTLGSWTRDLTAIAFSADGRWLAVGSEDGYVRLWDLRGLPAKFTAAEGRADVGGRLSD
jgi:WD40 repeat protein